MENIMSSLIHISSLISLVLDEENALSDDNQFWSNELLVLFIFSIIIEMEYLFLILWYLYFIINLNLMSCPFANKELLSKLPKEK